MPYREIPLSPLQREMWRAEQTTDSARENVYGALRLRGPLHMPALTEALDAVVRRHEPLRTCITGGTNPVQRIEERVFGLPVQEVSDLAEAIATVNADAATRIELDELPLWKVRLLRLAPDDHVLGYVFHHIMVDGWSLYLFLRDLSEAYALALAGKPADLPPLGYTYADYCAEESRSSESEPLASRIEHWRRLLPEELPVLDMPSDRPRVNGAESRGAAIELSIDAGLSLAMSDLAREHRCTVFNVILDAVGAATGSQAGTSQVILGVPFHNRTRRQQRAMVGYTANVLPMALNDLTGRCSVASLQRARAVSTAAMRHPGIPPEVIMRTLYGEEGLPYRFCLNVQAPPGISYAFPHLELSRVALIDNGTANFDYELRLIPDGDRIRGSLTYDADLFLPQRAESLWSDIRANLVEMTQSQHRGLA
ncbi:condensation domain-containing protein [Micromonospora sp. WMMD980]|uniref:condensation domain-containing protein n=1 Tax=Micromonospora sp. WMMD980 TaxID=3016088 RepID=UPI00241625B1|nr:condensation domain-containing protein [Micromonospora sp. WMMD980]MDG4803231.1 condensation domain-containing protein [Micromonospora sp. WMMD980]